MTKVLLELEQPGSTMMVVIKANYRRDIPIIGAVFLFQLLVPMIAGFYQRIVTQPALIRSGAVECSKYVSPVSGLTGEGPKPWLERPNNCSLVLVQKHGSQLVETYYPSFETYYPASNLDSVIVSSENGQWRSTGGEKPTMPFWLVLPAVGFLLIGCAMLHKCFRTASFFSWQLSKHPNDEIENVLYFYGIALFASFSVPALLQ